MTWYVNRRQFKNKRKSYTRHEELIAGRDSNFLDCTEEWKMRPIFVTLFIPDLFRAPLPPTLLSWTLFIVPRSMKQLILSSLPLVPNYFCLITRLTMRVSSKWWKVQSTMKTQLPLAFLCWVLYAEIKTPEADGFIQEFSQFVKKQTILMLFNLSQKSEKTLNHNNYNTVRPILLWVDEKRGMRTSK